MSIYTAAGVVDEIARRCIDMIDHLDQGCDEPEEALKGLLTDILELIDGLPATEREDI